MVQEKCFYYEQNKESDLKKCFVRKTRKENYYITKNFSPEYIIL